MREKLLELVLIGSRGFERKGNQKIMTLRFQVWLDGKRLKNYLFYGQEDKFKREMMYVI